MSLKCAAGAGGARYRILKAHFVQSVSDIYAAEVECLPEVAILGRSNVGKSSVINALCHQKSLAKTSSTPGRTRTLNYFEIEYEVGVEEGSERRRAYLVDLPGYGYAKASKVEQRKWAQMIDEYLFEHERLCCVVLLIDGRRDPGMEEKSIAAFGGEGSLVVVLTKADKLSKNELQRRKTLIAKELQYPFEQIITTSVLSGKQQGADLLTQNICSALDY